MWWVRLKAGDLLAKLSLLQKSLDSLNLVMKSDYSVSLWYTNLSLSRNKDNYNISFVLLRFATSQNSNGKAFWWVITPLNVGVLSRRDWALVDLTPS